MRRPAGIRGEGHTLLSINSSGASNVLSPASTRRLTCDEGGNGGAAVERGECCLPSPRRLLLIRGFELLLLLKALQRQLDESIDQVRIRKAAGLPEPGIHADRCKSRHRIDFVQHPTVIFRIYHIPADLVVESFSHSLIFATKPDCPPDFSVLPICRVSV